MDIIEGFIIEQDGKPAWLNLTLKYNIEFDLNNKNIVVTEHDPIFTVDQIASFTALYGVNASGKTELLIKLAQSCSGKSGKYFGILYTHERTLYLHRGKTLNGWECQINARPVKSTIQTIFYSCSPFDTYRRRKFLNAEYIQEVSPHFDKNMPFDITLVMKTLNETKSKMDFFHHIEFSLSSAIPTENRCITQLLDIITPPLESRLKRKRAEFSKTLHGWIKSWREKVTEAERLQNRIDIKMLATEGILESGKTKFIDELIELLNNNATAPAEKFIELVRNAVINANLNLKIADIEDTLKGIVSIQQTKKKPINAEALTYYMEHTTSEEKALLLQLFEYGILRYEITKISSGEHALLYLMLAIGHALNNIPADNSYPILLMIDEGETFLHPSWQRKYLSLLFEFLSSYETLANRIHLIITTHSLIVAGDCPPGSLFHMEKYMNINGFGLGPQSILEDVYDVADFSGEYSLDLFKQMIAPLKKQAKIVNGKVPLLIESLADENLKKALKANIKQ